MVAKSVFVALFALLVYSRPLEWMAGCPTSYNVSEAHLWGSQCPGWSKCSGTKQSPADVQTPFPRFRYQDLKAQYKPAIPIELFNNGKSVKMPVDKQLGNTLLLPSMDNYILTEVRWVSPSEHHVNGRSFDLEMQLVHEWEAPKHKYAILSIMFNLGATSEFLHDLFFNLPEFSTCRCGNGRVELDEECDNGDRNNMTAPDACHACKVPRCGDGILDSCEQCDMGDVNNSNVLPDRCRTNCILPACGDGVVDVERGEQCDDGNIFNRDGCSSICQWECGDNIFDNITYVHDENQTLEQCDNGTSNSNTAPNACRQIMINGTLRCLLPFCGDGVVDNLSNETCDNGVNNSDTRANACRTNCTPARCGDGVVDLGEQCDFGENNTDTNDFACSLNCTLKCGDGVVQFPEQCDLGFANNSDSVNALCRADCRMPRCGDGIVDDLGNNTLDYWLNNGFTNATLPLIVAEECDGPAPRCTPQCRIACGNGVLEPLLGEECDVSFNYNQLGNFMCNSQCKLNFCGDGERNQLTEECDRGPLNANRPNAPCRPGCLMPKCSDGILDTLRGEECDDGNLDAEDGCDPNCKLECGNSKIGIGEECDNGPLNANLPNKCRSAVTLGGTMKRCFLPMCGDGIVDYGEECDNGDANSDSAASACRTNCKKHWCGDGVKDIGEMCDNGHLNTATSMDTQADQCSLDCVLLSCRVSQVTKMWGDNQTTQKNVPLPRSLNLNHVLPKYNRSAISYSGSLTEPPCGDNTVNWIIFEEVQSLSSLQLSQFRSIEGVFGSQRPITRSVQGTWANALSTAVCGNGIKETGEECDEGIFNSNLQSDACRLNCRKPRCGDGVIDRNLGEECDSNIPSSTCNPTTCKLREKKISPRQQFWSYKRAAHWATTQRFVGLRDDNQCGGKMQSPISLMKNSEKHIGAVNADFMGPSGLDVQYTANVSISGFNTGMNTIFRVNTGSANKINYAGSSYNLETIEIHSPSEHHVNGKKSDFEIQYMHRSGDQKQLAVGVLYDTMEMRNRYLEQFWFYIPRFTQYQCGNARLEGEEECDAGVDNNDYKPNACRTNCKKSKCGDGVVDTNEQCDWGSWNSDSVSGACRTNCMLARCGDGNVDNTMGEQCDPLNDPSCDEKCMKRCGNGVVDTYPLGSGAMNETCDNTTMYNNMMPSPMNGVVVCRPNCHVARCGDGVVDEGEQCDAGDVNHGNGNGLISNRCRPNCTLPVCGDGVVDPFFHEECDDGSSNGLTNCDTNCKLLCGNGVVDAANNEQCDNGAANSDTEPNACRATGINRCRNPVCGDGVRDSGEECDDGLANSDNCTAAGCPSCSTSCRCRCGNGILDPEEECDWGSKASNILPGCCRTNCRNAYCGDGVVDPNEECDEGARNGVMVAGKVHCRANCKLPYCGDGHTDNGEECDGGPGCTATCTKKCGNGMKDDGEYCDNGPFNKNEADACRVNCQLPTCGDGIVDSGEECDTDNNGNGANSCRSTCTKPFCGDGVTDDEYGEECDNGENNNDLALNGCSSDCKKNGPRQCTVEPSHAQINLAWAFPKLGPGSGIFHYQGSQTRPPCKEGVKWFVFEKVLPIHKLQAHAYKQAVPLPNARGLQQSMVDVQYPTLGQTCGNCKVEGTEKCDDGPKNSNTVPGACRMNCQPAHCGDNVVDYMMGEQCDGQPGCNQYCKWVRSCPLQLPGGGCAAGNSHQPTTSSCSAGGSCSSSAMTPANSTIINVNFAGILKK